MFPMTNTSPPAFLRVPQSGLGWRVVLCGKMARVAFCTGLRDHSITFKTDGTRNGFAAGIRRARKQIKQFLAEQR